MTLTFHIRGLPDAHKVAADFDNLRALLCAPMRRILRTRKRFFMRDAIVALDGKRVGATYQETATVIYGTARTRSAWSSPSRAMKDRMRHALLRGEQFRDGLYRSLLR